MTPWRSDPALAGRFHPQAPDDLEALFFFVEARQVEKMWVRLDAVDDEIGGYSGNLLSTPYARGAGVAAGSRVAIRCTPGAGDPVWVSDATRANLRAWRSPCEACGFDLLFEPVEVIASRQFPSAPPDWAPLAFTTRCPLCGGTMMAESLARV